MSYLFYLTVVYSLRYRVRLSFYQMNYFTNQTLGGGEHYEKYSINSIAQCIFMLWIL